MFPTKTGLHFGRKPRARLTAWQKRLARRVPGTSKDQCHTSRVTTQYSSRILAETDWRCAIGPRDKLPPAYARHQVSRIHPTYSPPGPREAILDSGKGIYR